MISLYATSLTPMTDCCKLFTSLEGLVNPTFGQAMRRIEYLLSSRLPLDSCASKPSPDKDVQSLEAQEPIGNFVYMETVPECVESTNWDLSTLKGSVPMFDINTTFLDCYKIDNPDLAIFPGKRHTIDNPLVHKGDRVTVLRRMTHGYGYIYFFVTSAGLTGWIRSDAVSLVLS